MWSVILGVLLVPFMVEGAEASPLSRSLTREAYALAYDLEFAACYETLERAAADDPLDPAPRRAVAAITWIEILFAQGAGTFEAFTGKIEKGEVERPPAPPALVERFRGALAEAGRLATLHLQGHDDADAHYQMGATDAVGALYGGTVEGRLLGSFGQGRRAVGAMKRVRERAPDRREAALILGMSEYTVSTMSWPVRILARLGGLSGNRELGLALLAEAATPGSETASDAEMLLMIVDHREGRHADGLQRLDRLRSRHVKNRLLWLNQGASALVADRPREAERVLSEGLQRYVTTAPPTVLGETAMWFSHRAAALARLDRRIEAQADLDRALAAGPRDWVRGRIFAQRGDLALAAGDPAQARRDYESAHRFAERGGDGDAARDIKEKLRALERRRE
jgi:tetratricopeptide (TPR) repeat protein